MTTLEDRLRRAEELLAKIERVGGFGYWSYELATDEVHWSDETCRLRGLEPGYRPTVGDAIAFYVPPDRQMVEAAVADAFAEGRGFDFEGTIVDANGHFRRVHSTGEAVRDAEGNVSRLFGTIRDITADHDHRVTLAWESQRDPLTRLYTRATFTRRLEQAVANASGNWGGVIALADFDNMKMLNDTLGHAAGDEALRIAARTMRRLLPFATIARIGGDEFAFLFEGDGEEEGVIAELETLRDALAEPQDTQWGKFGIGCTLGVAGWTGPGDARTLLRRADIALYHGKGRARGTVVRYAADLPDPFAARAHEVAALGDALHDGRVRVAYQPIVDSRDGSTVAYEALMRVEQADGSFVAASEFERALSDSILSSRLLDQVLEQVVARLAADPALPPVAINVSAADMAQPGFVNRLTARLDAAGVARARLTIEITELTMMSGTPAQLAAITRSLTAEGIKIALDDFGTGYSSLTHLSDFPIAQVKIDRKFVARIAHPKERAIVISLAALAHDLGIELVAEGVESEEQRILLVAAGARMMQGWLFGTAVPFIPAPVLAAHG